MVAGMIFTDWALLRKGNHLTKGAVTNLWFEFYERLTKGFWRGTTTPQKVKRKPLCGFEPNTRELLELLNCPLNREREERHAL